MKILKLVIENFLVLTEAEISLDNRGLMLIQGANLADSSANSNGAGKSSIADALCWAIYGVTARGETGDQVINNRVGKGTRVEVVILDDMTTYRVVRHRKHKTGKNALHVFADDGMGEKDLTKGTDKLTQEVVDQIIGASLEVFTGSIYAGQEKMPDLPAMTDKMLKILIEEAAGVTALELAYKKARENAAAAKTNFDTTLMEINNLEAGSAGLQQQLDQAIQSEKDWNEHRANQVKTLTETVRDQLMPEIKRLTAEAPKEEIDRLATEIAAIDTKIASVKKEQDDLQQLQANSMKATMAKTRALADLATAQGAVNRAKNAKDQASHKIGCPCSECGRPLTQNEMQAVIDNASQAFKTAVDEEATALKAVEDAETVAEAAQNAMQTFRQGMTDVSAESAQRASLESQRNALLAKERERDHLVATAKNHMATVERLQAEVSPWGATINGIKTSLDKQVTALTLAKSELAVREKKLALEQEVVRVFSPAGVRARILDEVTPYLNGQTGKYLSILTDGNISAEWSTLTVNKAGEVKEKFAIDVSSPISSKTFKGLSGGEKRKVRIATALALQDLVATRATKPIELFVGDEIDDALDAAGLERLMIILEDKSKERGSVLVISHNSLKDEIRNVLTVERSASGETKITETVV